MQPIMFKVVNKITGATLATYKTKNSARTARDRVDSKYGAYIHSVVEVVDTTK